MGSVKTPMSRRKMLAAAGTAVGVGVLAGDKSFAKNAPLSYPHDLLSNASKDIVQVAQANSGRTSVPTMLPKADGKILRFEAKEISRNLDDLSFNVAHLKNPSIDDGAFWRFGVNVDQNGDAESREKAAVYFEFQPSHENGDGDTDIMYSSMNFVDTKGDRIKAWECSFDRNNARSSTFSFMSHIVNHFSIHENDKPETLRLKIDFGKANRVSWLGGLTHIHDTVDTHVLQQARADGGFVSLIRMNKDDEIEIGGYGKFKSVHLRGPVKLSQTPDFKVPSDGITPKFGDEEVKTDGIEVWSQGTMLKMRTDTQKFSIGLSPGGMFARNDTTGALPIIIEPGKGVTTGQISIRNIPRVDFNSDIYLADGFKLVGNGEKGNRIGGSPRDKWGFWGVEPVPQPEIKGSRQNGEALQSLLDALHKTGLIRNSTTD